jgi:hypothetical protein
VKFATYLVVLLGVLTAGCDSPVQFSKDAKTKHRFDSITVGTQRTDLRSKLGQPSGIVYEAGKTQLLYSRRKSREITSMQIDNRKTWPAELRVFSKCKLRAPADYFSDGKVRALFVFGSNESIICKEIHPS